MSRVVGAAMLALWMAGCGGGGGGSSGQEELRPVAGTDPLATSAWHLKNTGPAQQVSAFGNAGALAGIDANVDTVHQDGAGITGRGIRIAVVDSGLEANHEDLRANVLLDKSFNFGTGQSDPSPSTTRADPEVGDHGTGVAGTAAAKGWNNLGSRGLAPNAWLTGYAPLELIDDEAAVLSFGAAGLLAEDPDASSLALVRTFGARADATDIFNFSAGTDYASPPQDPTAPDARTAAAEFGTQRLRGGKGAIYLQAAGNEFTASQDALLQDGSSLPVNCAEVYAADGLLTRFSNRAAGHSCLNANYEAIGQPFFMKVAAISNTGKAASYSSAGASNWITGFGGESGVGTAAIVSTDDSGCRLGSNSTANEASLRARLSGALLGLLDKLLANLFGRSPDDLNCNYTGMMNGTSAATPSVAGIAALILEANPALTWLDVKYILARTARKVDAGIAAGAQAVTYTPSGATQPVVLSDPWVRNQGGFNFQTRYGFGLVDSAAAVAMARSYTAPAGRRLAAVTSTATGAHHAYSLPSSAGNVSVIEQNSTFPAGVSGPVQVDLVLNNTTGRAINPGTLQFELFNAATGERSILLPAYSAWYVGGKTDLIEEDDQQAFRFVSNAFYGNSLAGTWTLRVLLVDGAPNESTTFDASTLSHVVLTSHGI